jgi:hypothetical protein
VIHVISGDAISTAAAILIQFTEDFQKIKCSNILHIAEEGNLFSPGNDVEVDAVPLSSKVPVDVKYSTVTDIP